MRVAICDDNRGQLRILADTVKHCNFWNRMEVNIDAFSSGVNLLNSVRSGTVYEYIFLDIEMPELSGFDVYNELQSLCECPIVFVSTHIELLPEVFTLRPYGFLAKPYTQDTFDRTVRSITAQTLDRKHYHYSNDGKEEAIDVKNILYFCIDDYVLTMKLVGGTSIYLPRTRLDEVEHETYGLGFFRCNRSILINLCHCTGRKENRLVMRHTDAVINISRRRLKEFDKRLILYRMEAADAF